MKHTHILTLLALTLTVACSEKKQPQPFSVIPMPNDVTLAEGSFNVAGALVSYDENVDAKSAKAIDGFVQVFVAGDQGTGHVEGALGEGYIVGHRNHAERLRLLVFAASHGECDGQEGKKCVFHIKS